MRRRKRRNPVLGVVIFILIPKIPRFSNVRFQQKQSLACEESAAAVRREV